MPNHVHLLMTASTEAALPTLMQNLGQRYVQYVNRTYGRSGTLWEGRYRSCIAESAHYVLACYRYIELNPVRAGLVSDPASTFVKFPRKSELRNTGLSPSGILGLVRTWFTPASLPGLFDNALEPSLIEGIRDATNTGYPLGSEAFKSAVKIERGWKLAPGRPGRPENKKTGDDEQSLEIGL